MSRRSIRKRRHRVRFYEFARVTINGIDVTDSVKSVTYKEHRARTTERMRTMRTRFESGCVLVIKDESHPMRDADRFSKPIR